VLATSTWAFAGFSAFLPLYALSIHLRGSGPVYLAFSVTILAVRLLGARIPDRFGSRASATTALVACIAGLLVITLMRSAVALYAGAVVFGLGQSLIFPALLALAVRAAPDSERGSVVGTFTAFVDIGFGLGPLTLGAVAAAFGYPGVFAGGAVSVAIGLLILAVRGGAPVESARRIRSSA
jgi:MFS family permease